MCVQAYMRVIWVAVSVHCEFNKIFWLAVICAWALLESPMLNKFKITIEKNVYISLKLYNIICYNFLTILRGLLGGLFAPLMKWENSSVWFSKNSNRFFLSSVWKDCILYNWRCEHDFFVGHQSEKVEYYITEDVNKIFLLVHKMGCRCSLPSITCEVKVLKLRKFCDS